MTTPDANAAVLDALGIPWKGQGLSRVTICLRPHQPPAVHTVRHILHKGLPGITERRHRFTLAPADAPAFDLDDECRQAMRRLADHINLAASRHQCELRANTAKRLVSEIKANLRSHA